MRIFTLSIFLLGISISINAQTNGADHLLWFNGKKIKPNVLLTATGDTVFYNPAKRTVKVVSKAGRGKIMDNMQAELNKTPRRIQEMTSRLGAKLPKQMVAAYSVATADAYNQVRNHYDDLLSNTMTLPAASAASPLDRGKGAAAMEDSEPIEKALEELEEFMQQHKDDKITSIPAPPRADYSYCYTCQSERQAQYNRDYDWFRKEMFREEQPVFQKILNTSREANITLSEDKAFEIEKRLQPITQWIMQRLKMKVELLIEKYIDDPYRCGAVMDVGLSLDRMGQLLGYTDNFSCEKILPALNTVANLIDKAIDERDYSIALNLRLILSIERQFQMLMSQTMPDGLFNKAIAFNQFKLKMNASAKLSSSGGYQLTELKGENWFYAIPDSTCRLQWYLVGPYLNKMKADLVAAEFKGTGGEIPYVGKKNWNTAIPTLRIDFCDNREDTAILYSFHPDGFEELWQFPKPWGPRNVIVVNGILKSCFLDVKQSQADYAKYKNPENVEKLKKEMLAKYQQMMKNNRSHTIGPPKDGMTMTDLDDWAKMQQMSRDFSEKIHSLSPERFLFRPEVHNKDHVIFIDKINGKELFPQNRAIEYAWFHLRLEHDPEGPYGVRL